MSLIPKDFLLQLTQLKLPLNAGASKHQFGGFDILIPFTKKSNELVQELVFFSISIIYQSERLIITASLKQKPIYAQDWWPDSQALALSDYTQLKSLPHWGYYYHSEPFRQEKKIRASIKNLDEKRIEWKMQHPFNFKFFTWTVINDTILFCTNPFQRFPVGWHEFVEDKTSPPNRAYLKLWEIFLQHEFFDLKNTSEQTCLEVGCSPGGWTWVLAQYFRKVYAIDKAPLGRQLDHFKNINYQSADAFKLDTAKFTDVRWFFSDIICTPERMNELVSGWLSTSRVTHFVSTIKFKGDPDFEFLQKFQEDKSRLGHSLITHLYHNKNEVTWLFKKTGA